MTRESQIENSVIGNVSTIGDCSEYVDALREKILVGGFINDFNPECPLPALADAHFSRALCNLEQAALDFRLAQIHRWREEGRV